MKNIAQGLPLKKYKGNKHKDGGIMVNALGNKTKDVNKAVAEVEGGEYNFRYNPNNPKDNYILSKQLGIAGMAKQADRFKGNNRIDYNTRTNLLNKSMKLNEMLRVQQEQQPMQMAAFGGMLKKYKNGGSPMLKIDKKSLAGDNSYLDKKFTTPSYIDYYQEKTDNISTSNSGMTNKLDKSLKKFFNTPKDFNPNNNPVKTTNINQNPLEIKLGTNLNPELKTKSLELPTLPTTAPKTTAEAANTGMEVNTQNNATPEPTINKKGVKDVTSGLSSVASAFGPIGQAVGMGIQLAPYAIDLGKAMFDKTSVQDLQTQGSAMRLPNTTYAKNGGKLNVVPLPKFRNGGDSLNVKDVNPFDMIRKGIRKGTLTGMQKDVYPFVKNTPLVLRKPSTKVTGTIPSGKLETDPFNTGNPLFNKLPIPPIVDTDNPFNRNRDLVDPFNLNKDKKKSTVTEEKNTQVNTTDNKSNTGKNKSNAGSGKSTPSNNKGVQTILAVNPSTTTTPVAQQKTQAEDDAERILEYDKTIGYPNFFRSLEASKLIEANKQKKLLDVVEPPKQKDKLSEMLKSGLMLKGSAMAGSLFSALQPAQKETLRLPDFGRADDAMSRATAFSMNPALNEVEQARGKSQEAIRNMATTAGQLTSNLQSVNQRAGQQSAGLRVQEQQIMNQLAGQKAGYETQKASAIQQELARFDENTLMNKAATQDARVAFVENINNLGTEIMKQGNEQDIADQQDKLAVQNAKLKIIQSAFENPDIISGANLESILKMIEKGDYTNIPKLFGQPSDTRRVLKAEADRLAQQNK